MMHQILEAVTYIMLFLALYFEVFLLITYFEGRKEPTLKKSKAFTALPSVSIIVPCWNESTTVSKTLASLLNLNYPKEKLNILVVDDGSTDDTMEVAKEFLYSYDKYGQIKLLQKENGGKASALNFALEHVSTDLVGCLDADSYVDSGALRKIVDRFEDDTMAVTPSIKVHDAKNIVQLLQKVEYSWGILLRNLLSKVGAVYVTPGPFSIFRRELFAQIGGYREAHKTEDMELALRMQENKMRIENAVDAFVYTSTPKNLKALYKQRLRWTYGFMRNAIDYKHMFFNPKFGNLGIVVLPMATLSLFSSFYVVAVAVSNWFQEIFNKILEISVIGINWRLPTFGWFYVDTAPIVILGTLGFLGTLTFLIISSKLSEGRYRFGIDTILFMFLYVFITPIWIGKAFVNLIFAKETNWR